MRNVLCFVLLVPILALAAGKTQPVTALAPENGTMNVASSPVATPAAQGQPDIPARILVGTLDTIGGTTYDWWTNGPRLRALVNSPAYGVHAIWMYSTATTGTDFTDRNMRYNFYDKTTHAWNWLGPDYMADDGVNVFDKRAGYGSLDVDSTGIAIVSAHVASGSNVVPRLAKDAAPGAGIFTYVDGEPVLGVCQWLPLAVGQDGQINVFPITAAYQLSYSRIKADSSTFSSPILVNPSPGFPTHNIAASKVSGKIALVWEISTDDPQDAYMQTSTDKGATWTSAAVLQPPSAFGTDTVTAYHITSLFPWYDGNDRLHIVTLLNPEVNDTVYIIPSQLWHYCPDNTPQWSRITIAGCAPANLQAAVGYNASYACRPTIGSGKNGDLFVAWEQFDSANVEATTSRLRADIFISGSPDNGVTWADTALKLTNAGTHSMRFPSIIDKAIDGGSGPDTVMVLYEDDSISGFFVQGEGPASRNPVVVQKITTSQIPKGVPGVAEHLTVPVRLSTAAEPNPFGGRTRISYTLPRSGNVSLVVYDAAGRPVQTLASGRRDAGRYTAVWDAKSAAGGVYFFKLTCDKATVTKKLILAD